MSKQTNHTKPKTRRKWPWIILLVFVGLIGLVRLSLLTAPVHSWVKNKIVSTANNQLTPELSIGSLSGDLWSDATLTNVALTQDSTVASIDTVHLAYNPLSYFGDAFEIREVRLVRPYIKIRQQQDSTLNVQHWVTSTDTSSSSFAFSLSNFLIKNGRVDVHMPQLEQDSSFIIDDLNLAASLGYFGDSYRANIADFNLKVKQTRLDAPVSLRASAQADEKSITLENLAIATAHSMLQASGRAGLKDSTANVEAEATPLGWKDIAAYVEDMPVQKDVKMSLKLTGDAQQFNANLNANAEGIDQLSLSTTLRRDSSFVLTSLKATANRLNLERFMSDTSMPRMQNLDFQAQGRVPLNQYQNGRMAGTLTVANIHQGDYSLDKLQGTFSLENENAKIRLEPVSGGQRIIANATFYNVFNTKPSLNASINGKAINPAVWLQDEDYVGSLTFNGKISGKGWYPEQDLWDYNLTVTQSSLMDQPIDSATFSGRFNEQMATNQSRIKIAKSEMLLQARVNQLQTIPVFSYTVDARDVNLADFKGFEEYPSSITGTLKGEGRGNSLENLKMQTGANIDSSLFKGEYIDTLSVDLAVADSVVSINTGTIKSSIADAGFDGRVHVTDLYAPDNRLNLNIQLKDVSSFASTMDVETLLASGTIEGKLVPNGQDSLAFDGMVDLQNINYDNQFVAQELSGGLRVDLGDEPNYVVDFNISEPTISTVNLQNINLKTQGKLHDEVTQGSFEVEFLGERKGRILQAGNYNIKGDTIGVELTDFDLEGPARTLSLQNPFHANVINNAVRTDTLRLSTAGGDVFMELAIPYADTVRQKAYLKGKNLNLAVLQNTVLKKAYFEGVLFGEAHVDRTDTSLTASGNIIMSDLVYEETKLDTLQLQANVKNKRLTGMMELHQNGELIAEGDADIPFNLTPADQPNAVSSEQPVSGHLVLHALELKRFQRLLEQAGYENTEGQVQFTGSLEGSAGNPQFDAKLSLTNAQLSGVPVDSLIASVNYQHEASNLDVNATLTSLKQKALLVNAQMPLTIDLSNFDVAFPGPQDSVSVDIQTNNFNLKALNDFVNRETARDVQGRINGNITIHGPRNDLQTTGEITLRKGAVRVVPAGIRLDHMESTLQFERDKIVLADLHMESGKGNLNAQGELALQKLVPGDVDITVKARNFKAANTDEYNALIDLDLQVDGSVTRPNVSGKLQMINGFIELDNFGEKSVEQIELDTTLAAEPDISLYDSLSLDMDIEFNRRFFVRNQRYLEMEIELDGQLDVLKDAGEDVQLFGTLNTADGYARPLGKRFELEEGSLAFSGPVANPQINIRTLYEPPQADQEIKIWYTIEGTVEDPQFKYESSPPMDLAGIISYTLFGQPFYKLNPAEQTVASSSSNNTAADFAVEVLLDRVESLATRRLGIDVVRIEQTRVGGESGTSITTGWYINPKVFFAIQNVITGSTPTPGFYLEYYLQKNLKLILSQGNDNRQGADIQWEYDY